MKEKLQLTDILNSAIGEALSNLHTATIAKVTAVQAKTISVQPVINRVVDGKSIKLPQFTKVPPLFMQGGGSYTAHPIAVGDYCLLVLTERCFDRWYSGSDFQDPAEFRMHDYSDAIAVVGINPLAGALTIPSVIQQTGDTNQDGDYTHQGDRTQIGNLTITGDIQHTGNTNHDGDYTHQGNTTQIGNLTITGNMQVNGNITCTGNLTVASATIGGIDFSTHTHSGVEPGGGTTGGPQ